MRRATVQIPANPIYVGVDNGPSGSIGVLTKDRTEFHETFTSPIFDYTKAAQMMTLLDYRKMRAFFKRLMEEGDLIMMMERPMVNPGRWRATVIALRAHQQYLDIFTSLRHPEPSFIDSRKWQKVYLPSGIKGPALKVASKQVGCRMFPIHAETIEKHGDADGLFIAMYLKSTLQVT